MNEFKKAVGCKNTSTRRDKMNCVEKALRILRSLEMFPDMFTPDLQVAVINFVFLIPGFFFHHEMYLTLNECTYLTLIHYEVYMDI